MICTNTDHFVNTLSTIKKRKKKKKEKKKESKLQKGLPVTLKLTMQ